MSVYYVCSVSVYYEHVSILYSMSVYFTVYYVSSMSVYCSILGAYQCTCMWKRIIHSTKNVSILCGSVSVGLCSKFCLLFHSYILKKICLLFFGEVANILKLLWKIILQWQNYGIVVLHATYIVFQSWLSCWDEKELMRSENTCSAEAEVAPAELA